MTQRAAIAKALLSGKVLSTMDAFRDFFCTNLAREIGRGIERPFGLTISRDRVDFVSTYGQNGFYYRYRLNQTPQNAAGIKKMVQYIAENDPSAIIPAGQKVESKELRKAKQQAQKIVDALEEVKEIKKSGKKPMNFEDFLHAME